LRWRERLGRSVSPQSLVGVFLYSAFPSPPKCPASISVPSGLGLSISRDGGDTVDKFGFEEHIGVVKHAVFKRHYNELGVFEMGSEHLADVLGVRQIQSGVYFIEDIQRSWFKQQHRKDERQSDQRPNKKKRVKMNNITTQHETIA